MSPTVFRYKKYRFFFFSREEKRVHVHVVCPGGEAKFWVEPRIALAENAGLSAKALGELHEIIEGHRCEITYAWKKHFKS